METVAATAMAMLARGERQAALSHVAEGCERSDPEAFALRALWRVEGKIVPRDLTGARADLSHAEQGGHMGAARMVAGLMAAGVGGPRDWPGALAALDRWTARDPMAAHQADLIARMAIDAGGEPTLLPEPQTLSTALSVRSFPALLTSEECDLLVEMADRRMRPAVIFHEGRNRFIPDPIRDSDAAGFPILSEWPFVHAINRRLARASDTQVEQGEPLQILRYREGQQYRAHLDALPGLANQRIFTFLVYLGDDHAGGETRFPRLGLDVVPGRGDGLLFANSLPDGRPDPMSQHIGMPVLSGVKRVASRWIRQRPADDPDGFGQHEMAGRRMTNL